MPAHTSHRPLHLAHSSRWTILLLVVWSLLAIRIGYALVRSEPFSGDLGVPLVAFFITTAVVGSRIWSVFHPADVDEVEDDEAVTRYPH
jgi:hypothetical protein